jgi:steroid delta-isomerase-like uncharacterized protein
MSTAAPTTHRSNTDLIRWAFEKINEHDVTPLKGFWTDETLARFPDRTCRGAEELTGYFEDAFRALPDLQMEIVAIAEQDERLFVQWHLTGTHQGPLLGIEPTGRTLSIDGMDNFTLRDGTVVSNFVIFDQMQYARAIGMMPPDGSAADRALKVVFNVRTRLKAKLKRSA